MRYLTPLATLLIFLSHNAKTEDNQFSHTLSEEFNRKTIDPFLPVRFTGTGIQKFFCQVYNNPSYGTEFLPNDFSHLLQFLQHGVDTKQDETYAQSVFKLFNNKLKSASYVNAYVFSDLIAPLENLLKEYFVETKPKTTMELKVAVNDVLYSSFLSQFDFFKRNPKSFFDGLSNEILLSLNHELDGAKREFQKEQLRQTVIRFFEHCVSKLVWSPEEPNDIWKIIKTVSTSLAHLMEDGIIENVDHLDDLLWSLTHRLCFFIDLLGADLPVAFYQNIKQDLIRKTPILCKLKEQEQLMKSKTDHIMQAVVAGEARARAREIGILA